MKSRRGVLGTGVPGEGPSWASRCDSGWTPARKEAMPPLRAVSRRRCPEPGSVGCRVPGRSAQTPDQEPFAIPPTDSLVPPTRLPWGWGQSLARRTPQVHRTPLLGSSSRWTRSCCLAGLWGKQTPWGKSLCLIHPRPHPIGLGAGLTVMLCIFGASSGPSPTERGCRGCHPANRRTEIQAAEGSTLDRMGSGPPHPVGWWSRKWKRGEQTALGSRRFFHLSSDV